MRAAAPHLEELDDLEQLDAHAQREVELRLPDGVHELPIVKEADGLAQRRVAPRVRLELERGAKGVVRQAEDAKVDGIHKVPRVGEVVDEPRGCELGHLEQHEDPAHAEGDEHPQLGLRELHLGLDARLDVVRGQHRSRRRRLEHQRHARAHREIIGAQRHRDREDARVPVEEVSALQIAEELLDCHAHHARCAAGLVVRVAQLVHVLACTARASARTRRAHVTHAAEGGVPWHDHMAMAHTGRLRGDAGEACTGRRSTGVQARALPPFHERRTQT